MFHLKKIVAEIRQKSIHSFEISVVLDNSITFLFVLQLGSIVKKNQNSNKDFSGRNKSE